jgi:flagellar assembly factor FliW
MSSAEAVPDPRARTMNIQSDLLGPLKVETSELLRFPTGLFGFPEARDFVLLQAERKGVYWLQSAEHSALAFVLVDPFVHFTGYSVEIPDGDLRDLGRPEEEDLMVLAIVTLPRSSDGKATANLQGPLALNLRNRLGKQLAEGEGDLRKTFSLQD